MNRIRSICLILTFLSIFSFILPIESNDRENNVINVIEFDYIIPYLPVSLVETDGQINIGEYHYRFQAPFSDILIYWEHDSTVLFVGLVTPGTGWVGFGVGNRELDANLIMGGYADGFGFGFDMTGTEGWTQTLDTDLGGSDDILQFGASENATHTIFEFQIMLNTNDLLDPVITMGKVGNFFVAYHVSEDDFTQIHTQYSSIIPAFVSDIVFSTTTGISSSIDQSSNTDSSLITSSTQNSEQESSQSTSSISPLNSPSIIILLIVFVTSYSFRRNNRSTQS